LHLYNGLSPIFSPYVGTVHYKSHSIAIEKLLKQIMTTNHRNIRRRRSVSDRDIVELTKDSSIVPRSHSTFGSMFTWLKKRRKVIEFHQSQSEDAFECSSSSLSTAKMNDLHSYSSSTSSKNSVDGDNHEVAMSVSEVDRPQPQSYNDATDDALDDSLSTVKMSELVLSSSKSSVRLVHEALEYERCLRTQTVRKS